MSLCVLDNNNEILYYSIFFLNFSIFIFLIISDLIINSIGGKSCEKIILEGIRSSKSMEGKHLKTETMKLNDFWNENVESQYYEIKNNKSLEYFCFKFWINFLNHDGSLTFSVNKFYFLL